MTRSSSSARRRRLSSTIPTCCSTFIENENSQQLQKCDGWRLIERLRVIGHVDRPDEHVLARGTLTAFYFDCKLSSDGRDVLHDEANLAKLLKGTPSRSVLNRLLFTNRHSNSEVGKLIMSRIAALTTYSTHE